MDEFVHYHALGCATAVHARDLPVIRDGCGYFDLRLPFTRTALPLRSYAYIGSLPSLPFYPFWRLFDDPVASRVQGAVFFLLCRLARAAAPARARGLDRPREPRLPGLPRDVPGRRGPGRPLRRAPPRWRSSPRAARSHAPGAGARAAWAGLAGLVLFLGLWMKLVFVWWLPAFAVFALEEARRQGLSLTSLAMERASALLAGPARSCCPPLVLLASADRDGRPYAAVLWHGDLSAEPERVEAVAVRLVRYVTDGSLVAPRNLTLPSWPVDVLPLLLSVALLGRGLAVEPAPARGRDAGRSSRS